MGKCTWFEDNGILNDECQYSTERFLVKGKNRCIFHLDNDNEEKKHFEDDLIHLLTESEYLTFDYNNDNKERINLIGFVFPENINLSRLFNKNNIQLEPLSLSYASLIGADLYGLNLNESVFHRANLTGASFENTKLVLSDLSYTDLINTKFLHTHLAGSNMVRCNIRDSHFKGCLMYGVNLSNSLIDKSIFDYMSLQCSHIRDINLFNTQFILCMLQGSVFDNSRIYNTYFDNVYIGGTSFVNINYKYHNENMTYNNTIIFNNIHHDNSVINISKINKIYHRHILEKLSISTYGRDNVTISKDDFSIECNSNISFCNSDIRASKFNGVDIYKYNFKNARLDGAILRGINFGVKKEDGSFTNKWYSKRKIKSKMRKGKKVGLPIFEGANVEASDWADNREAQRDFVYAEYVRQFRENHPKLAWLWRVTCDYGRSIWRWALIALCFMALFGGFYAVFDLLENTETVWESFYFSIVAFTTLGFGDITPACTVGQILAAIEVMLGYIMLGGLISIFAVKVARRD